VMSGKKMTVLTSRSGKKDVVVRRAAAPHGTRSVPLFAPVVL